METLTLVATAFGLGLLFNAAPGPVFAATVQVGVRGGFRPALTVQLGSIVGDGLWAVLGLAGVGVLLELTSLRFAIGIAGVGYLLWLAWQSWRASREEFALDSPPSMAAETRRAWRAGVTLSLTNPQNVAYWAAIGSALGALGIAEPSPGDYAAYFAGFMLSPVAWEHVFAALVERVLGGAGIRYARITYLACALAFFGLAFLSIRDLWQSTRLVRRGEPAAPLALVLEAPDRRPA
ncbi:MAG: chemotaxis protein [Lysobacterales bacterium]|nr:MAG: chemotaxis protein [Xanthomonadales bacterium]